MTDNEMQQHLDRLEQYRKDQTKADQSKALAYIAASRAIHAGRFTEYQFDKAGFNRATLRRYTGLITDEDVAAFTRQVRADELSDADLGHLVTFQAFGVGPTLTGTLDSVRSGWADQRSLKFIDANGRICVERIPNDAMVEVL